MSTAMGELQDRGELVDVIEVGNLLGECVTWDDRREALWWTDIESCRLHCYTPRTRSLATWKTPERLCSFGLCERWDGLVAAFETGFALYEPGGTPKWLARPLLGAVAMRMNDGRVDRGGRFWAGALGESAGGNPRAVLYRLDEKGNCTEHEWNVGISNGLCWSPNGMTMYFADSLLNRIFAYGFNMNAGTISARRLFAATEKPASPDGSTVDEDGGVWNAEWGASRVVRYAPGGARTMVLTLPVSQPTCVAFGGDSLHTLYVSSARQGLGENALREQPQAGHVLVFETGFTGLREPRYRGA